MTVISPTYNGSEVLFVCLDALRGQSYRDFDVLVVDNGSTDGTAQKIAREYPEVKTLRFDVNLGFAKAVNAAIRQSGSPWLLLLNNDTKPEPGFLDALVRAIMKAPSDVGGVNPLVMFMRDKTIDNTGIMLGRRWRARQINMYQPRSAAPSRTVEIFGINAGGSIFRRAFFDDVGLFDEDFISYREDVDLSIRGRLRGWRFMFCPDAVIYHHHSFTGRRLRDHVDYYSRRNYLYYLIKGVPAGAAFSAIGYLILKDAGNIIHFLKSANGRRELRSKLKAYGKCLVQWPRLLKKRRAIMGRARTRDLGKWLEVPRA